MQDLIIHVCTYIAIDTSTDPSIRPVEVVMKGLVIVIPFISEELLKVCYYLHACRINNSNY